LFHIPPTIYYHFAHILIFLKLGIKLQKNLSTLSIPIDIKWFPQHKIFHNFEKNLLFASIVSFGWILNVTKKFGKKVVIALFRVVNSRKKFTGYIIFFILRISDKNKILEQIDRTKNPYE
jgi:hypothetical protein